MRIVYSFQGKRSDGHFVTPQVTIGRRRVGVSVDLDLSPDEKVSPLHARLWTEEGQCWITDLDSAHGTQVNGEEIKGKGKRRLQQGDTVRVGDTMLRLEFSAVGEDPAATSSPDEQYPIELIGETLKADSTAFVAFEGATEAERRLALLYDLPLRFGEETQLPALLQLIIDRVVGVISGAKRGALLLKDRTTGQLLRLASIPVNNPAVSSTLARRAIERCEGFIWSRDVALDENDSVKLIPGSILENQIESALYTPLVWKGEALGVVCVDNQETGDAFRSEDLRLLQAIAHHAAMAVSHIRMQEDLRRKSKELSNLRKLVPPQLAERLSQYRGRIRLGGEFREATILFSDIRGFTKLASKMEPEDVTGMLEDYFSRLVPIVSEHQGAVDKFVGDAIVAVFGSPAGDVDQHLHAAQAAIKMQAAMQEVNARRHAQGKPTGGLGIGIHCGEVIHGFIGSEERMEFTIIGDAVNIASRYCDGAAQGEVLISEEMYQRIYNSFEVALTSIETKHEGRLVAYSIISDRVRGGGF